jgi:ABC-type sulfate transport system permease subunit
MSAAAETVRPKGSRAPEAPHMPDLPDMRRIRRRRRITRSSIVGICLLYLAILLIAPLLGIAWVALKPGWHTIAQLFSQPDVQHAFYLTIVITVITVITTTLFGVIVASNVTVAWPPCAASCRSSAPVF